MFVCAECGLSQPVAGRCPADGNPLAPVGEDVLLGTTIGVYRVARLLGIGGMGRVYKGVHPAIGSRVAIKVLSRECSDRRDLVERFFAEAKAVNLIRHEGIVNVLDLATLPDGRPYIIMEYLDGAPLAALVEHANHQQAPLALGGLAHLIAEVLDALGAAHAKGIIHRDLKPDNIFVAPSGRPKVLDFGIAKLSDSTNTSTRTGSLMGTPHYMAPEQAAGRPVDHRADLYAIGVILFECATGRKPFLADALFDLLRMQVEAPPPPPRSLRPDMPVDVEQVILTALAKHPDQRFSTATAMSVALQHATSQLPQPQWQPLVPPSTRAASGAAWAPTPPVSWSGSGSQPPAARLPTPSAMAGPTVPMGPSGMAGPTAPQMGTPSAMPPHMGNPSTVTGGSGQVTNYERPGGPRVGAPGSAPSPSKKGLWIGLAVFGVLVAGSITAAVVSGGHGDGTGSQVASTDSPASGPGKLTPPSDPKIDPAKPDSPKTDSPKADPAKTDGSDTDSDEPTGETGNPQIDDAMNEAYKQIDDMISRLPPDQQKRLAAYKGLSKLPPAERMRRLQALARQGSLGFPLPQISGTPPAEAPEAPTSWITNHAIDPPPGYDPERVDVAAFLPWAIEQAKKAIPDAQLIRIDVNGVGPDGRANLKLSSLASDHGSLDVRFISPSRGKRDPNEPIGVTRHDFKCEFRVMATPDGVELMPINFFDCMKEKVVAIPRCGFAAIWKRAIAKKAPAQNAVANIDYYRFNSNRAVWYFAIGAGTDVRFSDVFNDDC